MTETPHFDIYAESRGDIHPELRPFVKHRQEIRQELLDSYVAIYEAAKAGKPIAAVDFTQVEERYNHKMTALLADVEKALPGIAAEDGRFGIIGHPKSMEVTDPFAPPPANPTQWVVSPDEIKDRVRDLSFRFKQSMFIPLGELETLTPKQQEALNEYSVYEQAITQRFGAPPAKHLDVDLGDKSRQEVMGALLANNPGVAVGDIHVFGESMAMLADQAKAFKAARVDTFYIEDSQNHFDAYSRLSLAELKQLHEKRELGELMLFSPRDDDPKDPAKTRLDSDGAYIEMLIAARENGIRVVRIDKDGAAREADLVMAHRLSSTNMTWSEKILADRRHLAAEGKTGGKFIVWGGLDHFTDNGDGKGLVDDVLGLPVVTFDKGHKDDPHAVRKGKGGYEADVYLPGGEQMMDAKTHDAIGAIEAQLYALRPLAALPALAAAIEALGAHKEQLIQSMYDESDRIHAHKYELKQQQQLPPPDPAAKGDRPR